MEEASVNNTNGRLDARHGGKKKKIKNSTKSVQKENA
jgi:hypothetical protein